MEKTTTTLTIGGTVLVILLVGAMLYGWPQYKLYSQNLKGQANLKQQEWEKKIQIEGAQANLESEKLNALAEIERAKGAAESIKIEGGSLTKEYIQYLWVRQNQFNDKTTIYIPTETNLPILEAGRLDK